MWVEHHLSGQVLFRELVLRFNEPDVILRLESGTADRLALLLVDMKITDYASIGGA